MNQQAQHAPCAPTAPNAPLELAPGWPAEDDDVAFGCECADPSLQIDHWRDESTASRYCA